MVRSAWLTLFVLLVGCTSGRTALRRDATAQVGCSTTYDCCIQRHPEAPEMCGAEASAVPQEPRPVYPLPMTGEEKKPWPYEHCVDLYETCKGDKNVSRPGSVLVRTV
jgi:hypothetical protein